MKAAISNQMKIFLINPFTSIRDLSGYVMLSLALCLSVVLPGQPAKKKEKPNIILIMADDLGWGDVGFNGNPVVRTPHLDEMASAGVQFTRAYAGAPVCSPTRGSCLTGRNAERYGIYFANVGHLPREEVTIAELLKKEGYATGFFGKWHLGTLSLEERDGHRGGKESERRHYSPPWENGFDVAFATEQAVPTWDPMKNQTIPTRYWTGAGISEKDNLEGDDSRVIMDRALPFIGKAARDKAPFLSVIWFHTPHTPVVAGAPYMERYPGFNDDKQHYYGCITAMDEQVGRLRDYLRQLRIEKNTLVFFISDNGPAGEGGGIDQHPGKRQQGTSGSFRGRKGSLYEGGIRVPALLEWPAKFGAHRKINLPVSTSDYLPTIMALLGHTPEQYPLPLDGMDIRGLIDGSQKERSKPLAFKSYKQRALMNDRFKLYSADDGATYELYDLQNDPYETLNLAAEEPGAVAAMKNELAQWLQSCIASANGGDYKK